MLALLLAGVAFALACFRVLDADVWWHLKSGEWVLQNGPPERDPFTFASADRYWIDLHWLFQVAMYLAFRAGGLTGVILLTASAAASAVLIGLWSRPAGASFLVVMLGWLPAVALMSFRFSPRPEMFSLVLLAAYLAILGRLEDRPRLAWGLPFLQVLWVNVHGLFVLGPIVLGFRLVDRLARLCWRRLGGLPIRLDEERHWWVHVGGAGILVAAACLVNPYGLYGALFPLELFPKVTQAGDLYKQNIVEFASPGPAATKPLRR